MERFVDFDKQDMEATIDLRCIVDALFPGGYDLAPYPQGSGKFLFCAPRAGRARLSVPSWPRGFGFLGPDPEGLYAAAAYRWWLLAGPGAYKSPKEQIIQHVMAKFGPSRAVYRASKLHAACIAWYPNAMILHNTGRNIVQRPIARLNRRAVFNQLYRCNDEHIIWDTRIVYPTVIKAAFNPGLAKYLNDGGVL